MSESSLQERVNSFDERHYRFVDFSALGDFPPPEPTPERVERERGNANRHAQRYRYFFEPLLSLYGGSLKGHRVLDLGCNHGYWSWRAAQAGADFVLGVDGRAQHIDHANLAFEAAGIDPQRYHFEQSNVLELSVTDFDIVLCLGLLYHVAKPFELFEVMVRAGAETMVIDTDVSLLPGSAFEVGHEDIEKGTNAVDYELVLWPTRQAVVDLATQFGFSCVPLALSMSEKEGMVGYVDGKRAAFIASTTTDLSGLPREVESPRGRRLRNRRS